MKRIFLFALICFSFIINAEADNNQKRLVLIEEFSNTGCGPCASYSPVLDTVVSYRLGEVISVKYHGNYPDPNDVFYNNQKEDMEKKKQFYDINAYPTTIVNGHVYGNAAGDGILNSLIDYFGATKSSYDLSLSATLANHQLHVKATARADRDTVNANLRLNVIAIEEYYENPAVFSNGETCVRNIARKMLPGADGYKIGDEIKAGTDYTYETTWHVTGFGSEDQLGVVAFLQDINTKEILATAYVPKKAQGTDNLCLMNVEYTPDKICVPTYYGTVTFRNQGANEVTRATLNVKVNGTLRRYDWTGSLGYLDKASFDFDDFTDFILNESGNKAEIWLSDINGTDRESNHFNISFSNSVQAEKAVMLKIYTDNKPEETTWKVFNSAGDVVAEGGPYTEKRKMYQTVLNLNADDCYSLEFYDADGDGISGAAGNGYFILYQYDGKQKKNICQGDYKGKFYAVDFTLKNADATLGINNAVKAADNKAAEVYDLGGRKEGRTTGAGLHIVKYAGKTVKVADK